MALRKDPIRLAQRASIAALGVFHKIQVQLEKVNDDLEKARQFAIESAKHHTDRANTAARQVEDNESTIARLRSITG